MAKLEKKIKTIDCSQLNLKTIEYIKMMYLKNTSVIINLLALVPNLYARIKGEYKINYKGEVVIVKLSKSQTKVLFPLLHSNREQRVATLQAIVRYKIKGTL